MKCGWHIYLVSLLAAAAACLLVALPSCRPEHTPRLIEPEGREPLVRVRLTFDAPAAPVSVRGKWQLYDLATGRLLQNGEDLAPKALAAQGNFLMLNGRSLETERAAIVPQTDGALAVNDLRYRGQLRLFAVEGRVVLVNALPLESYVAGVVGAEMPPSWHLEALKAQAVAARSYALFHMKRPGRSAAFDLSDSPAVHQAYDGLRKETDTSAAAAVQTRGRVLAWNDQGTEKVLEAFFHSTCGGRTLPIQEVWPGSPPCGPLAGVECGYCRTSPAWHWTLRLPAAMLRERLILAAPMLTTMGPIHRLAVRPEDRSPGGVVRAVSAWTTDGERWPVPVAVFRRAIYASHPIRSERFEVTLAEGTATITGRGYGHGVGLCQFGAQGLAAQGRSAEAILSYYYPGSRLVQVY